MENTSQRPIIIELDEVKKEIIEVVNNALRAREIPCFMLEPILEGVLTQVKAGAQAELERAKKMEEQKNKDSNEGVA